MGDTLRGKTGGPRRSCPNMDLAGRGRAATGAFAPLVLLATVLGGALATPSYDWPTDPFSQIGGTDGAVALAFNAGLAVSGALAMVFAVALWRHHRPAVAVTYAVGGLGLAGAGVFPVGSGLHAVAALFFFTAWLPPVVAGLTDWREGRRESGATAILLGLVAVGIWLPYDLGLSWAMVGYGAAELVSFVAWGTWSAWTARRLLDVPNAAVPHREGPA